jgi:hypothetical protein
MSTIREFPKSSLPGWGAIAVGSVLLFMFGIIAGMLMSKEDIHRAYDMGVRKGDTQGYWRAQGEHGVY